MFLVEVMSNLSLEGGKEYFRQGSKVPGRERGVLGAASNSASWRGLMELDDCGSTLVTNGLGR